MFFIIITRIFQLLEYGWKDAGEISLKESVHKSKLSVFFDILSCFCKYYIFSNQYKSNKMWNMPRDERIKIGETVGLANRRREKWLVKHFKDMAFLKKYGTIKWQTSLMRMQRRDRAYQKYFKLNDDTKFQNGVILSSEHGRTGRIVMGKKVIITRFVDIDYTGDITIGNGVIIAEGSRILTHGHAYIGNRKDFYEYKSRTYLTPLTIEDNVFIGARCIILPGVGTIGENSMISAGSVLTHSIPPNSMVEGNPAKVIATISPKMRTFYRYKKN